MKTLQLAFLTIVVTILLSHAAQANGQCSTRALAGKWVFATGIGRQALGEPFPPDKDVTAIGTMNIGRDGSIEGKFDVTVEEFAAIPNLVYSGTLYVNPDCTGTLSFINSAGIERTDSIVVVSRREILGMTQDPLNLWTYQVRRIRSGGGDDD